MGIPDPHTDAQFYDGVPARRLVAFAIDLVVIVAIWVAIFLVGLVFAVLTFGLATPLVLVAIAVTGVAYRWILLSQRSATVGMLLTGIEVRDATGAPLDPGQAFLHTAGFTLTLYVFPLMVAGWIVMATSPHRRLLHDLVLGTVVINRPA